jgi:hydrogenase maturation protease
LVIGYGNDLRRDDGAGRRVARLVEALRWPNVRALSVHQLTPELAEPLAGADLALFVDAVRTDSQPSARPIVAAFGAAALGHASDPARVLALTQALFGRQPRAWLITVPTADMGYGKGLSPLAKRGVRQALEEVRHLAGPAGRLRNAGFAAGA